MFNAEKETLKLKYKAPDICDEKTETLTIHNSCNLFVVATDPDEEIARREFDIEPKVKGKLDFSYVTFYQSMGTRIRICHKGKVPFTVNYDHDPPRIEGEGTIALLLDGETFLCRVETNKGAHIDVELSEDLMEYPEGESEPCLLLFCCYL